MQKKTIAERIAEKAPQPVRFTGKRFLRGLGLCCPFLLLYCVCSYIIPGYTFTALVCMCMIGVILFYTCIPAVGKRFPAAARWATRIVTCGLALLFVMFAGTEYCIFKAAAGTDDTADYMVILGAKVREDGPSVSLQDRIDEAYRYLTAHPGVTAVASGGQGADEIMSEAECIFENLVNMGISPNRIWMEDRASSTEENLRFSRELIRERTGREPEKLAVLSSEYHLFRASLMAGKQGITFVGIPAHTSRITQLLNHSMREFAGIWHFLLLGY